MDILFERNPEQKWNQNEDSSVSLEMEHSGFFDRIAQRFFKKPRVSHIALDKYGSAVWLALDGTKTVFDVLNMMNEKFPDEQDKMLNRLVQFMYVLQTNEFITQKGIAPTAK